MFSKRQARKLPLTMLADEAPALGSPDHRPTPQGNAPSRTILLDVAAVPGGGELHLYRRGQEYEILFGEEQLMGSWAYQSERALASLVAERLGTQARRVLIGGLGMGFTLAAARAALPAEAAIMVAELVPEVESWARSHLAHIFGNSLADPRVRIEIKDVHDVIIKQPGAFDAILLDVDNGPEGLISPANERLYCTWGLKASRAALSSGGILAIWSSFPDEAFAQRLHDAGFAVEEIWMPTGGRNNEPPHLIWLATRRD